MDVDLAQLSQHMFCRPRRPEGKRHLHGESDDVRRERVESEAEVAIAMA